MRSVESRAFSEEITVDIERIFLRRSFLESQSAALVCARLSIPMSRVLILNQNRGEDAGFLDAAIQLCRTLEARPVVLTVARTEEKALAREQIVRSRLVAHCVAADFDVVVGSSVRTAVARVARWRRCSHVLVERRESPWWWRWLSGNTTDEFQGLSRSLSFLSLPGP